MFVAVTEGAAIEDRAVIKNGTVTFFRGFQAVEEAGELLRVVAINLGEFLFLFFVVAMVGEVVVTVANTDVWIRAVAAVVGDDEGGDAGGVGLEGEGHHVEHELHLLLVGLEHLGGVDADGRLGSAELRGALDAALEVADGGEVFVELAAVGVAEGALEAVGIVEDVVEDALAVEGAAGAGFEGGGGIGVAEEALKGGAGIDFGAHRLRGGFPREVELVGAAVAGVAGAGALAAVATEFEGREARLLADLVGGDLIDGDAGLDVGAGGFARVDAGEETGRGAGVGAAAIAVFVAHAIGEAGDDGEIAAVGGERFENGGELVVGAGGGGGPVGHVGTVGDVDPRDAARGEGGLEGGGGGAGAGGEHRVEDGEGDGGAEAAEEGATGEGVHKEGETLYI